MHEEALDLAGHLRRVAELLGHGFRDEADAHIAAHSARVEEIGRVTDRRDVASLATMRALLDGRQADARSGSDAVLTLGRQANDPDAEDRYWSQRLWIVLEWGTADELYELLDHCRERAYRHDDVPWLGAIALLLARLRRADEAGAAFDSAARSFDRYEPGGAWLDLATDLAEAATLLGDPQRAAVVYKHLAGATVPPVVIGRGWVCKGATARYLAFLSALLGKWSDAEVHFRAATELHRRLDAGPLLARTLMEWGRALSGRDDLRSRAYVQEGIELGRQLGLPDFLAPLEERAS